MATARLRWLRIIQLWRIGVIQTVGIGVRTKLRLGCAAMFYLSAASCASTPRALQEQTSGEAPGELGKPSSDCFPPPTPPEGSWDVVHGLLRPGEHVRALEKVGPDLMAVHVSDANHSRTLWLRKFDGTWEEASAPSIARDAG